MGTIRIEAPTALSRSIVGVAFVDGVAEVDPDTSGAQLAFFRRQGYRIGGDAEPVGPVDGDEGNEADEADEAEADEVPEKPNYQKSSREDLLAFARSLKIELPDDAEKKVIWAAIKPLYESN